MPQAAVACQWLADGLRVGASLRHWQAQSHWQCHWNLKSGSLRLPPLPVPDNHRASDSAPAGQAQAGIAQANGTGILMVLVELVVQCQ